MQSLLEYASYMPHGYCLFWQPWLVILFAGSDLLIFLAYSAIPVALMIVLYLSFVCNPALTITRTQRRKWMVCCLCVRDL